jgi:hypothetical protein
MTEFEAMIPPLQALGDEMGNRIGPQLLRLKQATAALRWFWAVFDDPAGRSRACAASGLVARNGAPCRGPFRADSRIRGMLP